MITKIILKNYKRRLEDIYTNIRTELPPCLSKEGKNILKYSYTIYPILYELEVFIDDLENDIQEFKKEDL